jgi:lysophospholipase-2
LINFFTATFCLLGFDVEELSEAAPDDLEGLDASAAHVANLLSTEPADSRFLI